MGGIILEVGLASDTGEAGESPSVFIGGGKGRGETGKEFVWCGLKSRVIDLVSRGRILDLLEFGSDRLEESKGVWERRRGVVEETAHRAGWLGQRSAWCRLCV